MSRLQGILKRLTVAVLIGVVTVAGVYAVLKYRGGFLTHDSLCRSLSGVMDEWWRVGLLLTVMFSLYPKIRPLFLTVAIFFGVSQWCRRPIEKSLWLTNFSDTPSSVTIDGRRYTLEPFGTKRLLFAKKPIVIEGKRFKAPGTYVVNVSYPNKYLLYGPIRNVARRGAFYEASPLSVVKTRTVRIEEDPDVDIVRTIEPSYGAKRYYVAAVAAYDKKFVKKAQLYKKGCLYDDFDPAFCFSLARCYDRGQGVPQSFSKAAALYRRACDAGYAQACHNLAVDYDLGTGVTQNKSRAVALYKKACQGGVGAACFNLGNAFGYGLGVDVNMTAALNYYERACEAGEGDGCYRAGIFYGYGKGVEKNATLAKHYFKKGCIGGNLQACALQKELTSGTDLAEAALKKEMAKQMQSGDNPGDSFWQRAHYYMNRAEK